MGLVKKKKKKLSSLGGSRGASSRATSELRPQHAPKTPPCNSHCPNHNAIRQAITTISQSEGYGRSYEESLELAWYEWTERSPFPAVCGRVCPHPCEDGCNRSQKDGAVGINDVERSIGDYGIEKNLPLKKISEETYSEKIAILGAGPAGLACAHQLARLGYSPTVFEAFPKAGGMLRYGIPEYRLPHEVLDAEIAKIVDLGAEIKYNMAIGRDIAYEDIQSQHQAIFVGIGAHKGKNLRVEGEEEASNVLTGTDFLNRANSGEKVELGKKVIVIGGGDTAIDAARVSMRLGAEATILYRRTIAEMPAIDQEIEEAQEEGVKIEFLAAPISFITENGKATGMKCIRMELGEPDDSGRRRPVQIEGSEFVVEADTVIAAISQEPDFEGLEDLKAGPRDWVKAEENGSTAMDNTYAGGDVLDLSLVVNAIFQGRTAAITIHENLRGLPHQPEEKLPEITHDKMRVDLYDGKDKAKQEQLPLENRFSDLKTEVNQGLTREQMIEEAKRCMSCGQCYDCGNCWTYCQDQAVVKPPVKGDLYKFKMDFCQGCKKCAEECPCGFIEMV
jgi:dissimilatory sulfite reductase flavoprotein subunit